MTLICWKRSQPRWRSMNELPCARRMSATSTAGRCCFQIGMPQQELNLTKIFSRFQKVSRPAMSKAVRRYQFGDTSAFGSISNDEVDGFRGQGLVGTPVVIHPWEEIGF